MSLSDEILSAYQADKTPVEPLHVFGRDLFVKRRQFSERIACDGMVVVKKAEKPGDKPELDNDLWPVAVVITCLVDTDGKPVFRPDQLRAVAQLDEVQMAIAWNAAAKLNGLDGSILEDARKNSVNGQHSSSSSVLQES